MVERPASVAKELVENSIDAGAQRIEIDVEAGGRRLLRVVDDGEGMTRDDAVLAFERHATSKISGVEDLERIGTLGFRGEALASIASVARVELVTQTAGEPSATRVLMEGGRMRDVGPAARPAGTTITVRDLFFNVPARRKFLRSEATESFHLSNLVTHYALAHPETAFTLTNNGREILRAAPAADLRERAYQIFGAGFLENLLEVNGGHPYVTLVRGYVSAPRERRTTKDAQYLFVNGRFVRDRLISRALSEAYRSVLPHGVFPAALLFLDVPREEVDVNVHPAKTEVRFRRAAAVADVVREAVRAALATGGYVRLSESFAGEDATSNGDDTPAASPVDSFADAPANDAQSATLTGADAAPRQETIEFGWTPPETDVRLREPDSDPPRLDETAPALRDDERTASAPSAGTTPGAQERSTNFAASDKDFDDAPSIESVPPPPNPSPDNSSHPPATASPPTSPTQSTAAMPTPPTETKLPPLVSAAGYAREVTVESIAAGIRPVGQLAESFIIATDAEGLLLIDQHVAHERVLFDKYRKIESTRAAESQNLLLPETFDLTPAQAAAFDQVATELEHYGFGLMRLSGRTVAIKAVPADLPAGEARNMLAEVLDTVDAEKRGAARATMRDEIAASLACHAAIKINMSLTPEKMRWLIDRLLVTSSPTTCPHGRPILLRLSLRDIEKGFHRT